MNWTITTEYHKGPDVFFGDKFREGAEFFYAIRRQDGSLLFRTGTLKYAEEIVGRLHHTHREVAA